MKKTILVLIILMFIMQIFSTEKVRLPELLRPAKIEVGDDQIYIIEDTTIFVYGLNNLQLETKFGKKGEGPGEFPMGRHFNINMINLIAQKGQILINSRNKIMIFNKNGMFLSEKKVASGMASRILPFGNSNFVGTQFTGMQSGEPALMINLYDDNLNKIKQILEVAVNFGGMMGRSNKKINEFSSVFSYTCGKEKLYLFDSSEFIIKVLNSKGKLEDPIKVDYKKIRIASGMRGKIMDHYKNVVYKNRWESVKSRIEIPDKFPAIQSIAAKDGRIYVQTYKYENGKGEFYIFNQTHKLEKIVMIPLKQINIREFYPYSIKSSKLYQLVEDEDAEEWAVQISEI